MRALFVHSLRGIVVVSVCVMLAGCSFMARKPITYYQGGGNDFPDYKQGQDGKYYLVGKDGKLTAPDYSYRQDMVKGAERGAPIIPLGPGVTNYANIPPGTQPSPEMQARRQGVYPLQAQQPAYAPAPQQGYAPQGYAAPMYAAPVAGAAGGYAAQGYPQGYAQGGYAVPQGYVPGPSAPQPGQAYYYPTPGGPPVALPPGYPTQQLPQQGYAQPAPLTQAVQQPMAPRKIPLPTASGDNDESYDLGAGRMQVDETTGAPPPIQRLPNTPPAIPSRRNLPDLNSIYRRAPQDADEVYQPPKGMIGGNDAEDYHQLYNNF